MNTTKIGEIAERAEMANHNRDFALYALILLPYPWTNPIRGKIEAEIKAIVNERNAAALYRSQSI